MKHMVQDLICGKTLDWQSTVVLAYQGRLHYFCCMECLKKFRKTPRRYLCRECKPGECIENIANKPSRSTSNTLRKQTQLHN